MNQVSHGRFQVRQFEPKTLSWWRSHQGEIDMNPPYQRRGRLWSTADKAYLVDSILNGFDIPKLYIADFTWGDSPLNTKRLPYAIIDGKQRFEAIFDFFDGTLTLNSDFIFYPNAKLELGGLGYKDLRTRYPKVTEIFDNYSLHVMSVFSDTEERINDLFVRLNRSKPLTGAEIRNAMGGPVPEILRKIAKQEFFQDSVSFSVKRGEDLNAAAKLLLFEFHGTTRETKKVSLDKFVETAKGMKHEERSKLEVAARRVLDSLHDMASIFLPKDKLLSSAGIIPVYYWLVRGLGEKEQSLLRAFLVKFEESRKFNRERLRADPNSSAIDHELVEYDNYNRSTNDQISHEGRHKILVKRFSRFTG
jgi:hypothetical protein